MFVCISSCMLGHICVCGCMCQCIVLFLCVSIMHVLPSRGCYCASVCMCVSVGLHHTRVVVPARCQCAYVLLRVQSLCTHGVTVYVHTHICCNMWHICGFFPVETGHGASQVCFGWDRGSLAYVKEISVGVLPSRCPKSDNLSH